MAVVRSWLIRGAILAVLIGGGGVAVGLSARAGPEQVRAALIAALEAKLDDTDVHVGAAHLRLFGGVEVTDLRLTRRGETAPFFAAPRAVISHEKRTLHTGKLEIRKVEFDAPTVRLERREDGTWNVSGIAKPGPSEATVPTLVVRDATLFVTDRRPGGPPPLVVSGVRLALVNDPAPVLKVDLQATIAPATADGAEPGLRVPVGVAAQVFRPTGHATVRVEIPDITFTPDLAPALAKLSPDAVEYAEGFSARLGVTADLVADPGGPVPLKYDVAVAVRDGRFEMPDLPWPVEKIAATVKVKDGRLTVEGGSAKFGKASVELGLETRAGIGPLPAGPAKDATPDPIARIQDKIERLDLTIRDLHLDDEFFAKMPEKAGKARRMFAPVGALDVSAHFERTGPAWKRVVTFRPNRLGFRYEKFAYPVSDLSGQVVKVTADDGTDEFQIGLTGTAGGRRITAEGTVSGDGPDPRIRLKLSGTDLPIDERLFAALPPKSARALRKLRATGRGDFTAEIKQDHGVNRCDNQFRVRVYGGALKYDHFPYPLTGVKGDIAIYASATDEGRPFKAGLPLTPMDDTDRVVLRNFEADHAGGHVWLSGENEPLPGNRDRKMGLKIQGLNCPVDDDLRAALAAVDLGPVVRAFRPRGAVTFGTELELIDRNGSVPEPRPAGQPGLLAGPVVPAAAISTDLGFDPVSDLKMILNLQGIGVTPEMFPYPLDDLSGVAWYQGGQVGLRDFSARHGAGKWGLAGGEVRFADTGEVWARLDKLTASPLVPDAEFVAALPARVRAGVTDLNVRGPMELVLNRLVVSVPPGGANTQQTGRGSRGFPADQNRDQKNLLCSNPVFIRGVSSASSASGLFRIVARGSAPADPDPIVFWDGELRLSGAGLDAGLPCGDLYGVVATRGEYQGDHLGPVVGTAWFDKGTVADQPVTRAKLAYTVAAQRPDPARPGAWTPPVLAVGDLAGTMFQGTVGGQARVEFADETKYRLWLTASGVRLEDVAGHLGLGAGAELTGTAQAKVLLETVPDPVTGRLVLTGAGQVDVPAGRMYNLPVLLPLLKLIKLQAPDQTAFEEAHAAFELRGDRVTVSQLDLIGTAVSVGGSGEASTTGSDARFEFYPVLSQALKKWLTTPSGVDLTAVVNGGLFRVEVVRKDGKTEYKPHMLPGVTDPFRAAATRIRRRMMNDE